MSFFSGGRGREWAGREVKAMAGGGKKSQFYVEFLGWMESGGVRGRQYTEPVVQELKRRHSVTRPPKLTLQLTPREMRITQDLEDKPKPRSIRKIKFPAIPARDITFAVQSRRSSDKGLEDVVACIYLGYMPRTRRYVHVHVYRFDEPSTASTFTRLLNDIVSANSERVSLVERELAEKGEIEDPRLGSSDGMSEGTQHTGTDSAAGSGSGSGYGEEDGYPSLGTEDVEEDLHSLCEVQAFDSVAEELKHRLAMKDAGPLLLPPKDYDTISRARGNLLDINQRRGLSLQLAGGEGGTTQEGGGGGGVREALTSEQRFHNASEESGIDLASPSSDGGDVISRFSSRSGSDSSSVVAVQSPGAGADSGYVYPPRQDRGGPRGPLGRQSSQSSLLSNYSSHSSHHSDVMAAPNAGRRVPPVYRRVNSTNSFNLPPAQSASAGPPSPASLSISEDMLPPTDYDNDDDISPHEPLALRPKPFPAASTRRASGSDIPSGSSLLMRSTPVSGLYTEMHRGGLRGGVVEEEEVVYTAVRKSQPVYPSPRPW